MQALPETSVRQPSIGFIRSRLGFGVGVCALTASACLQDGVLLMLASAALVCEARQPPRRTASDFEDAPAQVRGFESGCARPEQPRPRVAPAG